MAGMGIVPVGAYEIRTYLEGKVSIKDTVPLAVSDVLFDPQTSGGLLISAPEKEGIKLVSALSDTIPVAKIIGFSKEYTESRIIVT